MHVKVSLSSAIEQELQIHEAIDKVQSPYLRPLLNSGHGSIKGAGDDLSFLHLSGWCQEMPQGQFEDMEVFSQRWFQVRLV
jgi:hypothetical protein